VTLFRRRSIAVHHAKDHTRSSTLDVRAPDHWADIGVTNFG